MGGMFGSWKRRGAVATGVALALFAGGDFLVWKSGARRIASPEDCLEPRVILVPGASVLRSGKPSNVLRQRIETALMAARMWPRARVVLSGTAIPGGYDEPLAMRNYLEDHGVDTSRLFLDRSGNSTRESILNLGAPQGRLAVVSQEWHLPRALWYAQASGWDATGLVAGEGTPAGWENLLREHAVRAATPWGRLLW